MSDGRPVRTLIRAPTDYREFGGADGARIVQGPLARFMHRVGSFAAHRHLVVLGIWLVAVVVMVGLIRTLGANTSSRP